MSHSNLDWSSLHCNKESNLDFISRCDYCHWITSESMQCSVMKKYLQNGELWRWSKGFFLETKCVGDKFEMLVTVSAFFIINIIYNLWLVLEHYFIYFRRTEVFFYISPAAPHRGSVLDSEHATGYYRYPTPGLYIEFTTIFDSNNFYGSKLQPCIVCDTM